MAITVELDQIDGMSATLTENGWEITRTAMVYGLTGTKSAKMINACNSAEVIAAGMPEIYDSHPDKSGAKLREISPSIIDTDTVKCTLKYRTNSPLIVPPSTEAVITVGASVQQIETNKDRNNNDLSVSHTYTEDEILRFGPFDPSLPEPVNQGGSVTVFKPQTSYEYSRKQNYSPASDAIDFVGKVNSGTWKGGAAKTWLCTGIVGRSNDSGDTYDVNYSFQYQPEGWNPYYVFLMPDGRPPTSTSLGAERKQADSYETANFGALPI